MKAFNNDGTFTKNGNEAMSLINRQLCNQIHYEYWAVTIENKKLISYKEEIIEIFNKFECKYSFGQIPNRDVSGNYFSISRKDQERIKRSYSYSYSDTGLGIYTPIKK